MCLCVCAHTERGTCMCVCVPICVYMCISRPEIRVRCFVDHFYVFKAYFKKFEVIMYNVIISFPYPFSSLYSLPCIPPHIQIHALFVYCCLSHTHMLTCIPKYMKSTCSDRIILVLWIYAFRDEHLLLNTNWHAFPWERLLLVLTSVP